MDNIIFEKDYRKNESYEESQMAKLGLKCSDLLKEKGILKAYEKMVNEIPRLVCPKDKENYEDLLKRLDWLAYEEHGHIRSEIDFQNWEARIELLLPYFQVTDDKRKKLMQDIIERSEIFTIDSYENGMLLFCICVKYFTKLDEVSEGWFEEELAKHPEFKELNEEIDAETQRILEEVKESGDDLLTKIGRVGELFYGVSADEFLNSFKAEFHDHPQDFFGMIEEQDSFEDSVTQ